MNAEYLDEIHGWLAEFLWPEPDGKQRAKRQRILNSATALFVRFGYRKTSIDEVARDAGVAKGTVYLYYRNKAELVLHAIALEKCSYLSRLEPLLDTDVPATDRLQALIVLGLLTIQEMPLLSQLTSGDHELALALNEVDGSVLERINALRAEFIISLLDEATGRAWQRDALLARAQVLVDLVEALAISGKLAERGESLESYAGTLAATLVHGIAAPADPQIFQLAWSAPPTRIAIEESVS